MRRMLIFSALLLGLAGCMVPQEPESNGVDELLASMDMTADPCVDFYQYACGSWLEETELPSDQARWTRSFSVIRERNREIVRDMLESAAADPGSEGTERWMIGTFYGSCMNEEAVEAAGTMPLESQLAEIAQVEDAAGAMAIAGKSQRMGGGAFFGPGRRTFRNRNALG